MIQARHLTKRYGPTVAVDDLSFDVVPGRVTGFLGPNGAGKSTTMRMILGLDAPDAGEVTVHGTRYQHLGSPLRAVGALLDPRAVQGGRSARNHLLWLAQSNRVPSSRVDEVLDLVGLSGVAHRHAGGFSLGMAQRLGIAAALLGDPGVLLFDEPVNGLDPEGIAWIRGLLQSLAHQGRTVFVSSHLMSEMAVTADHLIVIGRGRLIADTSMRDFLAHSSNAYVRVRSPQADDLAAQLASRGGVVRHNGDGVLAVTGLDTAAVGEIARGQGLAVHELVLHEPSLETAYMELTHDTVDYRAAAAG
jgi:ABC-2 type transport system ATP-binding protein